ncbi:amidohydrolase [Peribacillus sp. NPDC097295]|uniref:amidohydrolase n=1 Tax=Peribacillus sp. NPDC097295 TaxID=3364402 RepID=UPI003829A690
MSHMVPADLIIENVSVITMDPLCPYAKGVVISNGKILELIRHDDNKNWPLAPGGERVDGNGMSILPGLIDAHCHLRAQISQNLSVPCGREDVTNIEDIILTIRERSKSLPVGSWIRATGYDFFHQTDKRYPTRWDLDKATTNHPVRLRHVTRHASILNSKALELAGIGTEFSEPIGITVERDPDTKTPTGLIYGGDAWLSQDVIPPLTSKELHIGAQNLQTKLLSKGITSVQDATPTNSIFDLKFWSRQMESDWVIAIQMMTEMKNYDIMKNFLKNNKTLESSNALEMGPIKVVMESLPQLYPDSFELSRLAIEATLRGVPLAIHVVDPEMVWSALEAIRHATDLFPQEKIQHRLEHLSLCPEAFLPDISELDIIVVTNPSLVHDHGDRYLSEVEISEHSWLYRMNSLLSNGIPMAAGSDAPVATFNPWIGIQTACTRATSSGKTLGTSEKTSRWQALKLYTTGAALAAGWQKKKGMIRPGFQADIIALDQNPLTCKVDSLVDIHVLCTWIRGILVYKNLLQKNKR